jgi:hypothetical protein
LQIGRLGFAAIGREKQKHVSASNVKSIKNKNYSKSEWFFYFGGGKWQLTID